MNLTADFTDGAEKVRIKTGREFDQPDAFHFSVLIRAIGVIRGKFRPHSFFAMTLVDIAPV